MKRQLVAVTIAAVAFGSAYAADTPAPADKAQKYGGLFWLNRGGQYKSLPRDMYWPAGHHGQVALVIPSADMAIVRLGHSTGAGFDAYLESVVGKILLACGG